MKELCCFIVFVSVKFIYGVGFIISFSLDGQGQEMTSRIYTERDGLPSSLVYGTYQDNLGYLWIGSNDGLSRFDGKYFTNYGQSPGMPLLMDSHLRLWYATSRDIFELKEEKFINYAFSDSGNIRWVFKVVETKQGNIWALTSAGVYQFNSNQWQKVELYPGYENHPCRSIVETREGLYINYGDLLVLRKQDSTYRIIGDLKTPAYYYNELTLSAGKILISTLDGICAIINERLVKLPGQLGRLKGLYVYFHDSKKRCWVASAEMGLTLLPQGDTNNFISIYRTSPGSLISSINEDSQGNIWVTTGNGLIKFSEKGFKIFDIENITRKNFLCNVLQPPTGPLLINNGSLTLHTYQNGIFASKKLKNSGKTPLPNNELIIDNYAFDDKGRQWYYVRGFALTMQDGHKVYEQSKQLTHLGDEVFDVAFDTYRKKILVAVRTQNIPCQFNDSSYSALPVVNSIEVRGNIMRLHQCANGTILFATDRGLVYSVDKQNICKLQLNEFNTKGIIRKFCNDPSGDTWIIYADKGLRRYSWYKDSLIFKQQLTKADGLSTDNVTDLCFDNKNNLWASTNSNVTVFSKGDSTSNKKAYQLVSFFNAEDLQTEGGIGGRLTKDSKGNIWYFSNRHLVCFYPSKIIYNSTVPSIQIENVELNLRQTKWTDYTDSVSGIFQLPYNPKLSHNNNTLGFYFKGISSSGTEGIKYSYQLEGLENLWSNPTSNYFVSFVKLPPGKYIFKVKAQLPNTEWSDPASFSFEIKKAFWQTWWYFLLWALVILASIYSVFRYRFLQKIKFLEMRNRISQDLHDEIGASLSGINLLSQVAAEKLQNNNPAEASEFLGKVKNYSQDVIEKLSDMVWLFNPQNDGIEKILQRLKYFAMSIASSKDATMHFSTGKGTEVINLSIRQRKAIYLVSKEAINNAVKYAECMNIYFHLTPKGPGWKLEIRDDGKGFLPTANKNGNGLKNMYARADEIGARFKIQSNEGAGTIIVMEL